MPSKYVAKNPRKPKVDMTDMGELARRAIQKGREIHAARVRLATATVKRLLRHHKHYEVVDVLLYYMQLDEIESIIVDIRAKQRIANALAEKNRHRQAS